MSGYFWCRKTKWLDNKPVVVWRGWVKEGEAKTRALTELGFVIEVPQPAEGRQVAPSPAR